MSDVDCDITTKVTFAEMSGKFDHAEGWRRRLHLGFSAHETDPLAEVLGSHWSPANSQ